MEILVRSTVRRPGVSLPALRSLAGAVLRGEHRTGRDVGIQLVGRRAMRTLNERYTGRRGPTDVLSFEMAPEAFSGDVLGDVFVCVDLARSQARALGEPVRDAVARLVIHGLLHLTGYDHTRGRAAAARMDARQARYLARWKAGRAGRRKAAAR